MKKRTKSRGLGDTIAKITEATGIDKLAKSVANAFGEEDCGCERRRQTLNELVPYEKEKTQNNDNTKGHETGSI